MKNFFRKFHILFDKKKRSKHLRHRNMWLSTIRGRQILHNLTKRRPKYISVKNNALPTLEWDTGFLALDKRDSNIDLDPIIHKTERIISDNKHYIDAYVAAHGKNPIETPEDVIKRSNNRVSGKPYMVTLDLEPYYKHVPFIKLALNKEIVSIVSDYLGEIPKINDIRLLHSPNTSMKGGSQYYHYDKDDVKSVKLFFVLSDTDPEVPSLRLISTKKSSEIMEDYGPWKPFFRFSDEYIESQTEPSDIVPLYGKKGDIWLADVCRCLHYGSRPARLPRTVLWVMYLTESRYKFPMRIHGGKKPDLRKHVDWKLSEVEKYMLSGPYI